MATTASLLVRKTGAPYRGGTIDWANRYHFSGGTPADTDAWHTLAEAVAAVEKTIYRSGVHIIEFVGYADTSDEVVYQETVSIAGTNITSEPPCEATLCGLIRWSTDARTSKNHPIYLFSYIHGIEADGGGSGDISKVNSDRTLPAMQTLADDWVSGFSDGTNTYHRAGPNGAVALDGTAEPLIRSHQFPS